MVHVLDNTCVLEFQTGDSKRDIFFKWTLFGGSWFWPFGTVMMVCVDIVGVVSCFRVVRDMKKHYDMKFSCFRYFFTTSLYTRHH